MKALQFPGPNCSPHGLGSLIPTDRPSLLRTLPWLRRLETVLAGLDTSTDATVAVVGPSRRRWPKALSFSVGPLARELDAAGRLVAVPLDRRLALHGLDSAPLPPRVLAAGAVLADLAVPSSV